MHALVRLLGSLLAGVAVFLAVLVGLTELLAPHVWPAVFVSGPVAVVAAVLATGLAYLSPAGRDEGDAPARTHARFVAFLAGVVAFALVGAAAALAAGTLFAVSYLVSILFVGLPIGLLAGVVAALATASYRSRRGSGSRPLA